MYRQVYCLLADEMYRISDKIAHLLESFDFDRCILLWQLLPVKFTMGREIDINEITREHVGLI